MGYGSSLLSSLSLRWCFLAAGSESPRQGIHTSAKPDWPKLDARQQTQSYEFNQFKSDPSWADVEPRSWQDGLSKTALGQQLQFGTCCKYPTLKRASYSHCTPPGALLTDIVRLDIWDWLLMQFFRPEKFPNISELPNKSLRIIMAPQGQRCLIGYFLPIPQVKSCC